MKRLISCAEGCKMDRDIKFRAWNKATKNMYKVAQIDFYNERVGYLFVDPISQSEVIGYADFSDIELMQFTGVKDDSYIEIYEGDIVQSYMDNGYQYGMLAGVVEFVDGCYFVNNTLLTDLLDVVQVIGNKYEYCSCYNTKTKRINNMKLTEQTIQLLKRIMDDLGFEATQYKWGTNEADVLMEFIAVIEGIVYLGDRGR